MNEREQILALAKVAGFSERQLTAMFRDDGPYEITTPKPALVAFYHAARKPLLEEIERLNVALVLARAGFSKAASGHISQKFFEEHFEAADSAIRRTK